VEETQFFIPAVQSLAKGKYDMCSEDGTVKWKDDATDLPTDAELEAERKRLEEEYKKNKYQRDRQYPEIGDQLDALYHDMTSGKGDKTGEWYKTVKKVKDDNPKPE